MQVEIKSHKKKYSNDFIWTFRSLASVVALE